MSIRSRDRTVRLSAVVLITGIGAGLSGMCLALLLHAVQHLAYGYSLDALVGRESFLQGVSASPPPRRVLALLTCGVVAGFGWWAVYRFGRPLVSIRKAVAAQDSRMPVLATVGHALLQIVTVGLGSPLGREVAPREIGALMAGWLSRWAGLSPEDSKIMIACGAGAGLAAVYNVPLGGALFVTEVLLRTFDRTALVPALATSVIAAVVAWVGLGNEAQYTFGNIPISGSLVTWSILAGPVLGYAGYWYSRLAAAARAQAARGWRLVVLCILVFTVIGLVAVPFPQLLGNGKGPVQLGLGGDLSLQLAAALLVLKLLATTGSLWAGAEGGMLTPGMTIGALMAVVMGTAWNLVCPVVPLGAFAIVGAAGFLASSMSMPLTAIALIMEFTRMDHDFLVPVIFSVAGAALVHYLSTRRGEISRPA